MPWVAAAGAVVGGVIGASGSKSAAGTQAGAATAATNAELQMFNTGQNNAAPFLSSGVAAQNELNNLLGIQTPQSEGGQVDWAAYLRANPDVAASEFANDPAAHYALHGKAEGRQLTYTQPTGASAPDANTGMLTKPFQFDPNSDPGYQWRLQQGENAILNTASATGGVQSGATLKGLSDYAQGSASQVYNTAFDQWNTTLNNIFARLSGVAGTGANASLGMAGIGSNVGSSVGSNIIGAGNANAAGTVGAANALTGAIGSGTNNYLLAQAINNQKSGGNPNTSTAPTAFTDYVG